MADDAQRSIQDKLRELGKKRPELSPAEARLIRLRLLMERREPKWMRMNSWLNRKLQGAWRRPKSLDNKIKKQRKGYPPLVKSGYGKPKLVRGLHPTGYEEVIVHNVKELDSIDPRRQAIRIARTIGLRKRIEIIRKATEKGIRVLNATKEAVSRIQEQ
ncbi:50S ribosomal protein L32e [Thermocladium modestius]|uniref:Large ribosomal subunit protein eL32 n=1 Tax=Thermocladium modestius TaxID=62609 RepID=A0A830GVP4_9CREN|nr:50S ribosomal protein L32e [Thermocladium modestius]GGP21262.1 50S ribosomal protein L32e [Thermocladium modestius]